MHFAIPVLFVLAGYFFVLFCIMLWSTESLLACQLRCHNKCACWRHLFLFTDGLQSTCTWPTCCAPVQPELKAKLSDKRYNIAMENHEFGVAPEAFTKWIVLNDTYDILSTSIDRYVPTVLWWCKFCCGRNCFGNRSFIFCLKVNVLSWSVLLEGSGKYA